MSTTHTLAEPAALAAHRAARRRQATARRGPASFFWGSFVTEDDVEVLGAPGAWSPLLLGRPGLRVRANAADGIRIGGVLVDGEAVLHWRRDDGPTLAEFPDGAEGVIFSYHGDKFALQVWNPRSEWARRFHDIAAFPWDPSWQLEGTVRPVADGRTVTVTHHRDPQPVQVPVVAEVSFAREGRRHTLLATAGGPDRQSLFLHFRDTSNGSETYAAGRSLRVVPDGDRVVLDFNFAALLPCSFSLAWNCPLPPAENVLPISVRAGEQHAVDAAGRPLL